MTDKEVIFDLTKDASPDTTFTYEELIQELGKGLVPETEISKNRVYQSVASANKLLSERRDRYLSVVRRVGYRVIQPNEHMQVAGTQKKRADAYIKKGIDILQNCRIDEMTEVERALHGAQLMVMTGLAMHHKEMERRQTRQEELILGLKQRMDKIDGGDESIDVS